MRTRRLSSSHALLLASSLIIAAATAACTSDPGTIGGDHDSNRLSNNENGGNANGTNNGGVASNGNNNGSSSTNNGPALPNRSPVMAAKRVTTPREVLTAGPFTGEQPSIRANDRHATPVTGKDCMTCHGTGGSAPHFSYGGTIALGKSWTWGTPPWATNEQSGNAYGSYDGYGSYNSSDGDSYGDLGGGGGGGYGDDGYGSYDDGGYGGEGCDGYGYDDGYGGGGGDGYGYGDDDGGYGDDYGDDSYGQCRGGGKGWPQDRSYPSPQTGVRIVGSDGYVFDTVTDSDGNFWFKASEDVKVPAYTGIRYGTFTVTGDTNGIACGSCHESGKADSPGRLWTWDGPTPRR